MNIIVNRNTGDWIDSPFDFTDAVQVAASRSGSTVVYRLADGRYLQVYQLKSGNVEADYVAEIPSNLTVRF